MTGPAYERFRMVGLGEDDSLHYCSNCKNCDISCPCDVPVSSFIMRARAEVSRERSPGLRDWILAHSDVLSRWLRFIPAGLKNFGMGLAPTRFVLDRLGISRHAPLPDFASQSFHKALARYAQPKELPRKVAFFPGCFVNIYAPQSGLDMVAVLNRAGYEVVLPEEFTCCGLPLVANGFWEDARKNATVNMAALKRWKEQGLPVITGCSSCALMFKHDYQEYFSDLLPQSLSPALADACEFLLEAIQRGELALPDKNRPQSVVYHAPCHLRVQGIGLPGLDLLREIPGLTADNADAGCCGISGSYGFKKDKYAISMRVGDKLFTSIKNNTAPVSASECGTCRVQMHHGGGKPALHPISVLRQYLD
jgi:glycerol-3-phosphate dehydrogenase subunit C